MLSRACRHEDVTSPAKEGKLPEQRRRQMHGGVHVSPDEDGAHVRKPGKNNKGILTDLLLFGRHCEVCLSVTGNELERVDGFLKLDSEIQSWATSTRLGRRGNEVGCLGILSCLQAISKAGSFSSVC